MRKRPFLIAFIIFFVIGIILFIFKQTTAATIALAFSVMMLLTTLTNFFMNKIKINKLDQTYFVYKKDHLLKEYNKLIKDIEKDKLKALSLVYIKLKEEYELSELKKFGLFLTNKYNADPSGYDDGIVVLFVNIHPKFMDEVLKLIQKQVKEEEILVEFNYGYSYYEENIDYESLRKRAVSNLKG